MINIEMLTEMFAGDKSFVSMLFGQYIIDNKDANIRIQEQFDSGKSEALFHTMHTLSGALSSLCEVDIVSTIKNVEAVSRQGEKPSIDDINHIKAELDKIITQMETYLA